MHKRKVGRTFSRKRDVRRAFLRSLARAFVLHGRIATTDARARELRPFVERLVTHAKKGTLASRRFLIAQLGKSATGTFTVMVNEKYGDRRGGYTRVIKHMPRKSDGARLAIIEFV